MKNIICDIDQIIVDMEQPMIEIYRWLTGNKLNKKIWSRYYLRDMSSHEIEKKVFEVLWDRDFRDMPLIPYAKEGLSFLAERYNVYFATSRHSKKIKDTYEMIQANQLKCRDVIFSSNKAETARKLNARFAIEDYLTNAVGIAMVCEVYLFDYPYNRENSAPSIIRVSGFKDENWWLNFMEIMKNSEVDTSDFLTSEKTSSLTAFRK